MRYLAPCLIAAAVALSSTPARAQSDSFTGTTIDTDKWDITSPLNSSSVTQNEVLQLVSDGTAGNFATMPGLFGPGAGLGSRCKISGDFDMTVAFDAFTAAASNFSQAFFGVYQDADNQVHVKRIRGVSVNGVQSVWKLGGVQNGSLVAGITGNSGTFRVNRVGNQITTWVNTSMISSQPLFGGEVFVSLVLLAPGGGPSASVDYDDFNLAAGATLRCPDTVDPTADAGPDQSISVGDSVVLNGSDSFDDRTAAVDLVFEWTVLSAPIGSTIALANADTVSPDFVADLPGDYVIELVVEDEASNRSPADTVTVSSLNLPPVADAGPNQVVKVGEVVVLDGSNSTDPEEQALTFNWIIVEAPAGSTAVLFDATTSMPTLTPEVVGGYEVELIVNDGFLESAPSIVGISAIDPVSLALDQLLVAAGNVNSLPDSAFDARGHRNFFSNKIRQAIDLIQSGNIADAIAKIQKLLDRTDGCALRGFVDPKGGAASRALAADFIVDCFSQSDLYVSLKNAIDLL